MEQMEMEEISLRELIEILLKRKTMIIGITVLAVLASAMVSFFMLEPVYETKMVLMASDISDKPQSNMIDGEGVDSILKNLNQYPNMTMDTYKEQIKSPQVMRETIEELGLEEKYDIESLARSIKLETIENTNLLNIKMESTNPELASEIVNTVGAKFLDFVSSKAKEQANATSEYVETQMEVEKEQLDKVLVELKDFLAQPNGVNELSQELTSKLDLLTEYKTNLIEEELQYEVLQQSIREIETQLAQEEPVIITEKSILEDGILSDIAQDKSGEGIESIADIKMSSEEINPIYIGLQGKNKETTIELAAAKKRMETLERQIVDIQNDVEELQIQLAEKQHEERLIEQKVNIAQNTYDAFTSKHEEMRVTESALVGESSMTVVSKAYPTTNPVGPKKMLNIAIAAVLGAMVGVFVAFFIDYWQNSGKEKGANI